MSAVGPSLQRGTLRAREEKMDSTIALIVSAVTAGAAAIAKHTTEEIVKDAYNSLKKLIQRRYPKVNVEMLEDEPKSPNRQAVVSEDLQRYSVAEDPEIVKAAKTLLVVLNQHDPAAARDVGLIIRGSEVDQLTVEKITSTSGTGAVVDTTQIGNFSIGEISVGSSRGEDDDPKG